MRGQVGAGGSQGRGEHVKRARDPDELSVFAEKTHSESSWEGGGGGQRCRAWGAKGGQQPSVPSRGSEKAWEGLNAGKL